MERENSYAELEALRAVIQKLESEMREKPPPSPVVSEKEVEERRRAEEKAAQEILQLTKVDQVYAPKNSLTPVKPVNYYSFPLPAAGNLLHFILLYLLSLIFKEVQALQTEKDSLCKETEELAARLLQQERAQEGSVTPQSAFVRWCRPSVRVFISLSACLSRACAAGRVAGERSADGRAG